MPLSNKAVGLTAIVLSLASSIASAEVVFDSAAYTDAAGAQQLLVSRFNPALGTLNSATLTFGGALGVQAGVHNASPALNLTNVQVSLFGDLIASAIADGPAAASAGIELVPADTFMGSRTFLLLGPGAQTSTGLFKQTANPIVQTFSGASLQGFVGTGQFGFVFASDATASVAAQFTSVQLTPSAVSSASLAIRYDYTPTPVPLPGGLVLMFSSLGVAGFVPRKAAAR